MKSLLKWVIIGTLVVILLPVVIGVIIINVIDPNEFKPQIADWVQNNTRGELSINGDLDWSLYPNIGVDMNDVSFRLPEDQDEALANLKSVKLSVKSLPLLRGAVEADGVLVDGLKLTLETSEEGINNWSRIFPERKLQKEPTQTDEPTVEPPVIEEQDEVEKSTTTPFSISIAEVAVRDSSISYNNRKKDRIYQFENVSLNSNGINTHGDVFPLELEFDTNLSDPELSVAAEISGRLSSDLDSDRFSLADGAVDLDVSGPELSDKNVNVIFTAEGSLDRKSDTLNLDVFELNVADVLRAALQVDVEKLESTPVAKGSVNVEPFNLNELLRALGQQPREFAGPTAMDSIALDATVGGPENSIMLEPLSIKLDDTTLAGRFGISDLETRSFVVNLKGDKLNLDDYSAPPDPDESGSSDSQPNAALLPIAALQPLLFKAELVFQKLQVSGLTMTDFKIDASGNKGVVELKAVDVNLYDGLLTAHGEIDTNRDTPSLDFAAQVNRVDLGPLLADASDADSLRGKANIAAQVSASGNSTGEWTNSLNGRVDFNLQDGAIEGVNADKLICEAIALVRNETLDKSDRVDRTDFEAFSGAFDITGGIASNNDLSIASETMDISGQGTLDINSGMLDYRIAIRLKDDGNNPDSGLGHYGEACRINERYRDITWPIRCSGQIEGDPGSLCGVDKNGMKDIVTELARGELQRKLLEKYVDEGETDPDTGEAKETDPTELLKKKLIEKLF